MVLKSYLFCQAFGHYQQYTNDQSETFLKPLCRTCSMNHQIAIHRNGNLMYYAYTYKKSESEIYGLCIVCGEVCLNIHKLYEFFQQTLESTAQKGVLFRYDEQGRICKNVTNLSDEVAEIDSVFREIKVYLDKKGTYWDSLPPEDLSIPLSSKIALAFNDDDKSKIIDAIKHYHNVIVTMDNIAPSSFAQTVERVNAEKKQLLDEKVSLEKEIESLARQKKQYRWVAILSIAVIASLVGLYFLNDNLSGIISNQSDTIKNLETNILDQKTRIKTQNICINSLQDTLLIERTEIKNKNKEIQKLNAEVALYVDSIQNLKSHINEYASLYPIRITNVAIGNSYKDGRLETSFGSIIHAKNSMLLKPQITYVSVESGRKINLKVKWYMPDGKLSKAKGGSDTYSYQIPIYTHGGTNTIILPGWGDEPKGFWYSGTYRIEIWYDNVCLRAANLTLY